MKRLLCVIAAGLISSVSVQSAESRDPHQKGKKHSKHERIDDVKRSNNVSIHVVFLPREMQVLREYYAPRYRNLPPGLQKKYARTGQLPPGWRKKMEPFPVAVERQLVVLPSGYRRGVIDGHAVIYNPRTQVIVDLAVLF